MTEPMRDHARRESTLGGRESSRERKPSASPGHASKAVRKAAAELERRTVAHNNTQRNQFAPQQLRTMQRKAPGSLKRPH